MERKLTIELMKQYEDYLFEEEKAKLTIEKYKRDIMKFYHFLSGDKVIEKRKVIEFKEYLKNNYQVSSANSILVALNRFLEYAGWFECKVRQFKIQRTLFCKKETYLTKKEYENLITAANEAKDIQLSLLMQTICSTGIRVSELQFITVQSLKTGYAQINNKGKVRVIFIPKQLIKVLRSYCVSQKIEAGPIFLSKTNSPINRTIIWKKMKGLCHKANVDEKKVFPHNLRHLFAFVFYSLEKNLLRLAEVLGHSSIETTRIYTATTGDEHQKLISKLDLVYDYSEFKKHNVNYVCNI